MISRRTASWFWTNVALKNQWRQPPTTQPFSRTEHNVESFGKSVGVIKTT
jgi:hypothetical protein